jgi:hypothetical protein
VRDERDRRDERDDEGTKVVLNAATGGAGPLPVITTLLAAPISVVSVTLDVDELRNPSILLHFTSIISLPLGISVTLNFEVLRIKDNGSPIKVGSTYTFSTLVDVLESESFAFQLFDADLDPGTYTYTVVLSTNSIIDITPGLTIVNATLSALGVDEECKKKHKKRC